MATDALAPFVARSSAAMVLCEISKPLSYTWKDSNYLCHVSVKE